MDDNPLRMTSHRPYLLRALYEWVVDNGMTPHVLVDAQMPGVTVPRHSVKDGRIVLNIADRAVSRLDMGDDSLRFTARFGGVSQAVNVPLYAIIALYARETGHGMALPPDPGGESASGDTADAAPQSAALTDDAAEASDITRGDDGPGSPDDPPKRGSHLRIVK
ncbi:MAG: ClpXP protease specificity-enhancing factor [Pseudomonadota bacterium]